LASRLIFVFYSAFRYNDLIESLITTQAQGLQKVNFMIASHNLQSVRRPPQHMHSFYITVLLFKCHVEDFVVHPGPASHSRNAESWSSGKQ
jgi:hypothetical protein